MTQLRVLGLDRPQLVEQRVVVVVADLRVVEHVVAVAVVLELPPQLGGALRVVLRNRLASPLGRRPAQQPLQVAARERLDAGVVGEVEVHRRDRDPPGRDRGEVGARARRA